MFGPVSTFKKLQDCIQFAISKFQNIVVLFSTFELAAGSFVDEDAPASAASFADRMNKAMREVCKKFGGPRQFLQKTFPDKDSQARFVNYMLSTLLPVSTTIEYHSAPVLPMIATEDIATMCTSHYVSILYCTGACRYPA